MKKIKKYSKYALLSIPAFLVACLLLLHVSFTQNLIKDVGLSYLEKNYKIKVDIEDLSFSLFTGKTSLDKVKVYQPNKKKAFVALENLQCDISVKSLLKSEIYIESVLLKGVDAEIKQNTDSIWTYDFLINAFATSDTVSQSIDTSESSMPIRIGSIDLKDISLEYITALTQDSINASLKTFSTHLRGSDIQSNITFDSIMIDGIDIVSSIQPSIDNTEEDTYSSDTLPKVSSNFLSITNTTVNYTNRKDLQLNSEFGTFYMTNVALDLNQALYKIGSFGIIKPEILMVQITEKEEKQTEVDSTEIQKTQANKVDEEPIRIDLPELSLALKNMKISDGSIRIVQQDLMGKENSEMNFEQLELDVPNLHLNQDKIEYDLNTFETRSNLLEQSIQISSKGLISNSTTAIEHISIATGNSYLISAFLGPGIIGKPLDPSLFKDKSAHFTIKDAKLFPKELLAVLEMPDSTLALPSKMMLKPVQAKAKISIKNDILQCENLIVFQKGMFQTNVNGVIKNPFNPSKMQFDKLNHTMQLDAEGLLVLNELSTGFLSFKDTFNVQSTINGTMENMDIVSDIIADQNRLTFLTRLQPSKEVYALNGTLKLHDYVANSYQKDLPNKVHGTIDVSGKGFDVLSAEMKYDINLAQFYWNKQSFSKFHTKGDLKNDQFSGEVSMDDEKVNLHLNLLANSITKNPHITVSGSLNQLNLNALGFNEQIHNLKTTINVDFEGSEVDELNGTLALNKIALVTKDTSFFSPCINITFRNTRIDSISTTQIDFDSKRLSAHYNGNIPITKFSEKISETIISHIPGNTDSLAYDYLIKEEGKAKLDIRIRDLTGIAHEFIPEITEIGDIDIDLSYTGKTGDIHSNLSLENAIYEGVILSHPKLMLNCSLDSLEMEFKLDSTNYDEYTIPQTYIDVRFEKDTIKTLLDIWNKAGVHQFQLATNLFENNTNQWTIALPQNKVYVGGKQWEVNQGNFLELSEGKTCAGKIEVRNGPKVVLINGNKGFDGSTNYKIDLDGLELAKIGASLSEDYKEINGALHTKLNAYDVFGDFTTDANLEILNLSYGKDTICDIRSTLSQNAKKDYIVNLNAIGDAINLKTLTTYSVNDSLLNSDIILKEFDVASVAPFATEYLDSLKGSLSGKFNVAGPTEDIKVNGNLMLNNLYTHSMLSNTAYSIDQGQLRIKDNQLNIKKLELKDEQNMSATFFGNLDFRNTDSIQYLFNMNLDHFTLLNTTGEDPDLEYFGLLKSTSNIQIHDDAGKLAIDGVIKIDEESALQMRYLDARDYNRHEGLIKFVKRDKALDQLNDGAEKIVQELEQQMEINTRLEINPKATMQIIMDPVAGDYLLISGSGNLFFRTEKNGVMTLNGTYEVKDGLYRLSFYSLVQKKFSIVPGSTLIWTGDPFNPRSKITCAYKIKTSPKPLLQGDDENTASSRLPFNVLLHINDQVLKPTIDYDIELDEDASSSNRASIETALELINRQQDEEIKQVFSLLTLGKFTARESGNGNSSLNSSAYKSVSDMLSNQLNNLSQKYIKDFNVDMDVELSETSNQAQPSASVSLNFEKGFLDNRIIVAAGGGLADPNGQSSNDLSTDINVTYRLSEDGRLNLSVYRKGTYEGEIEGDVIKTGITFIFLKNYDKFKELLQKNKTAKVK